MGRLPPRRGGSLNQRREDASLRYSVQEEETDSEGTWAISYGDMVTLLLCFFILFFQIRPEEESVSRFEVGLIEKLNQKSLSREIAGGGGGVDTLSVGKGVDLGIDTSVLEKINGIAHQQGQKIIVEFPGVSFFKSGSTELTSDGRKAILKFAQNYSGFESSNVVGIRAFTDTKSVRLLKSRAFKDNLELSALRSVATMKELVKGGIPMSQIRVGGFGELKVTARELERFIVERERERAKKELDRVDKEIERLERSIASVSNAKKISKKDRKIAKTAEKKLASYKLQRTKIEDGQVSMSSEDKTFLRDRLARTVVIVIEPRGAQQ